MRSSNCPMSKPRYSSAFFLAGAPADRFSSVGWEIKAPLMKLARTRELEESH
jgi:hypothetical protein